MTFPAIKIGGFSVNDTLTSSQMNAVNADIQVALDGGAGGTYNPTAQLVIGGEGIWVQELANIAALKAINTTSMSTGALRRVIGLGRFYLDKSVSDTEDQPMVVSPTSGGGTWFSMDDEAVLAYQKTFTASGAWVQPRNLGSFDYDIVGGGGGGGGGANSTASTDVAPGGGGGGAGLRSRGVSAGNPTTSYTITIGAGGAGGAAVSVGSDGGNTTLGALATALGGKGGGASVANSGSNLIISGGGAGMSGVSQQAVQIGTSIPLPPAPYSGGASSNYSSLLGSAGSGSVSPGGSSFEGFLGGAAGSSGTNASGQHGGTGGGGGAAGPLGAGGAGGNGGNGNSSGSGQAGTGGIAAAANTGAGGGGGGGAGAGSSGTASSGTGGAGGSGQVVIRGRTIVQSYV